MGGLCSQTVIEYVQELQALLKCGPSHGSVAGKPSLATVGSGGGPMAGTAAVVGSGPYGVATPGGGFEVLQSSQGVSGQWAFQILFKRAFGFINYTKDFLGEVLATIISYSLA